MLLFDKTVTVIKRESGGFRCIPMVNACWRGKKGVSAGASGDTPDGSFTVRFSGCSASDMPKPGDYIALGSVSAVTDMADLSQYEYFRVSSVYDNRNGFHAVSHVKVKGV